MSFVNTIGRLNDVIFTVILDGVGRREGIRQESYTPPFNASKFSVLPFNPARWIGYFRDSSLTTPMHTDR